MENLLNAEKERFIALINSRSTITPEIEDEGYSLSISMGRSHKAELRKWDGQYSCSLSSWNPYFTLEIQAYEFNLIMQWAETSISATPTPSYYIISSLKEVLAKKGYSILEVEEESILFFRGGHIIKYKFPISNKFPELSSCDNNKHSSEELSINFIEVDQVVIDWLYSLIDRKQNQGSVNLDTLII